MNVNRIPTAVYKANSNQEGSEYQSSQLIKTIQFKKKNHEVSQLMCMHIFLILLSNQEQF